MKEILSFQKVLPLHKWFISHTSFVCMSAEVLETLKNRDDYYEVCIVQKKDTGQMYAMKYMSKAVCLERDALRNVLREIEILVQLEHPFLVNLWFSFHDEEDMFLVQDLLLGGDLRYHLTQNVHFPLDAVALYMAEIASALDYLQSKRIIHRDIKPDNILLDEEGHAHLTDFNVATLLEENQLATSLSGTKPYMAPEVYACSANEVPGYDFAVDWWSLGIVAFELSTGRRPYDIHSQTSSKDIRLIFHKSPEWPPHIPEPFIVMIRRLLLLDPSCRLKSLDELKAFPLMVGMDWEAVVDKKVAPVFTPPKGHLNCDPTFELEEMIVESKPLHKKKKRLAKQRSLREFQSPSAEQEFTLDPLAEEFTTFNRQKELDRLERERKEKEWEEELLRAMEASGSPSAAATREFRLSDSQLPSDCESKDSTGNASPASSSTSSARPSTSKITGFNGAFYSPDAKGRHSRTPHSPDTKKSAWSKSRSVTMPEGSKVWSKSRKS